MNENKEFERALRAELKDILPNTIWQNEDGVYSVFGKYRIEPLGRGYRVYCHASDIGIFNTSKTALSWCIADKAQAYNTARDILELDVKLTALTADINVRASLADRSDRDDFSDVVGTKLETKIIRKKQLENQLTKCVNWAKSHQSRNFVPDRNKKK